MGDALRARFTNMRCRVKNGAREFWDESTNKWKRMNAWRAVVEAVGDAGEFLDARWDAFKARMKNVRCRVRDGVREYYDEKKGEWKAMTRDEGICARNPCQPFGRSGMDVRHCL